jgi:hypothetical protein
MAGENNSNTFKIEGLGTANLTFFGNAEGCHFGNKYLDFYGSYTTTLTRSGRVEMQRLLSLLTQPTRRNENGSGWHRE